MTPPSCAPRVLLLGLGGASPLATLLGRANAAVTVEPDVARLGPALDRSEIVILAVETMSTRAGALGILEARLDGYLRAGGRVVFSAPVVSAFEFGRTVWPHLVPAVPWRESSRMWNRGREIMHDGRFPCEHRLVARKSAHPAIAGIAALPSFHEGERGTMYSALHLDRWKPKPSTDIVLETDRGDPALSFGRWGAGAVMFILCDWHDDGGARFAAWPEAPAFLRKSFRYLCSGIPLAEPDPGVKPLELARRPLRTWQAPALPPNECRWRDAIARSDTFLLSDNQVTVGHDADGEATRLPDFAYPANEAAEPGIGPVKFYAPITYLACGLGITIHDSAGRVLAPRLVSHRWTGSMTESVFACGAGRLTRRLCVEGGTVLLHLDATEAPGGLRFLLRGGSLHSAVPVGADGASFVALLEHGICLSVAASCPLDWSVAHSPLQYSAAVAAAPRLTFAVTLAPTPAEAWAGARKVRGFAAALAAAERRWDSFFRDQVPRLCCEDLDMERIYYSAFAAWFLNLYDIPYAPWTGRYSCPSKMHFDPLWEQDTPPAVALARWLHDKSPAAEHTLMAYDAGCALNANATPEPLPAPHPHTCGEVHQFAFAFALLDEVMSDPSFRRRAIDALLRDEAREVDTEFDEGRGLYVLRNCLGMDDSPRWDLAMSSGRAEWFRPFDHGLLAPDLNAFIAFRALTLARLLDCEGRADEAAVHARRAAALRERIVESLWSEEAHAFVDRIQRTGRASSVLSPYALLPLLLAPDAPARKWTRIACTLGESVRDPAKFGAAFPLPTVQRSHPDYAPDSYWRGAQWGRSNWLALRSLEAGGQHDAVALVLRRQLALLKLGGVDIRETFNPESGEKRRCRLFTEGLGCFVDQWLHHHAGLRFAAGAVLQDRRAALAPDLRFVFGPFRHGGRVHVVTNGGVATQPPP